jgi:hypothetical protein
VLLLGAGFALGGWFGLAVAALGVVAVLRLPTLAPWLPVGLLGLAAVATVIPEVPNADSLRHTFADDRSLAASAALAAGIVLLVVLVDTAVTGAAAVDGPTTGPVPASRVTLSQAVSRLPVPALAAAVTSVVLRLLAGGPAVSGAEAAAVAGLRTGDGFTADVPPLAVGLDALSPVGAVTLTAVLAGALPLAVGWLTSRLTNARIGTAAAVATAVIPLTWASPLAVTVGLLALVAALALLAPHDADTTAALGGGLLLGVATLSRPELGLVALAALAWCGVRPRPLAPAPFVAVVAAAIAVTVPWLLHVEHRTGSLGLVTSLGDTIRSVGELGGGAAVEVLTVVTMGAAVGAIAVRHRWFARRLALLLPLVVGAVLALVLLAAEPDVVALYPAMPMAALALARVTLGELDRRASHR